MSRDERERERERLTFKRPGYDEEFQVWKGTVSFDGMACDGRIRDPFLLPRGISRNEGEGRGGGDLADAIYAARFLFPGSHTC